MGYPFPPPWKYVAASPRCAICRGTRLDAVEWSGICFDDGSCRDGVVDECAGDRCVGMSNAKVAFGAKGQVAQGEVSQHTKQVLSALAAVCNNVPPSIDQVARSQLTGLQLKYRHGVDDPQIPHALIGSVRS